MRVIIVGAGYIGTSLLRQISKEKVDIVIIDKDEENIERLTDEYDCNGYVGNGCSAELLQRAGISSTSLLVALTKSDETNMMCCSVAKRLGVKRTIAAVRSSDYLQDAAFIKTNMGVDYLINPDKIAAQEIMKLISYAGDVEKAHFGIGNVDIATIEIKEDSVLADAELKATKDLLGMHFLVCNIDRRNKIITPTGSTHIKAGDKITILTTDNNMDSILDKLDIESKRVKSVLIVGGGRIGRYLAELMLAQRTKVTIIDNDIKRCQELTEQYPEVTVICGDGTNYELMDKELGKVDACVTMTGKDDENLIISMYAKSIGMQRIVTEIDNDNYGRMLKMSGVNHTISTQDVAIGAIIRDMRLLVAQEDDNDNNIIKWYYSLDKGKVEFVEFELTSEFKLLNIPFKDKQFKLKNGILIAIIVRDNVALIPNGESTLQAGDHIIIVSSEHKITKLTEILA